MLEAEKDYQLNKLTISSLKNQKAFDAANKRGTKFRGKYMMVVKHHNIASINSSTHHLNKNSVESSNLVTKDNNTQELKSDVIRAKKVINLGIKATKKLGNAVVRNKIRRRIKALIRSLPILKNQTIVVIPYKGFDEVKYDLLKEDLINMITN